MASQHPHHLCLDLVGAQCLTSFCSDTVGSLWRRRRKENRQEVAGHHPLCPPRVVADN